MGSFGSSLCWFPGVVETDDGNVGGLLQQAQSQSLTVQEARRPHSQCQQGWLFPEAVRENPFLAPLLAFGGDPQSLAFFVAASFQFLPLSSLGHLSVMCHSPLSLFFFFKDTNHGFRPILIHYDFILT